MDFEQIKQDAHKEAARARQVLAETLPEVPAEEREELLLVAVAILGTVTDDESHNRAVKVACRVGQVAKQQAAA